MGNPHILAIPYPAQGHVIPMMELSQWLVKHGIRVTFVNTDYNHIRVKNAWGEKDDLRDHINLASIPDGLEVWEDRNDLGKLTESILRVMPGKLEELMNRINASGDEKITCVIADGSMGWAMEVAEKMKIHRVAFWPPAAALLYLSFCIPRLIDEGVIDKDGTPQTNQTVKLAPKVPAMYPANFVWSCIGDLEAQKIVIDAMVTANERYKFAEWTLCNSAYDLEPGAFDIAPEILPIGPLLASNRLGDPVGYFWKEDSTCLKWLDEQKPNSVIYVAFGSFTVFDQTQFQELALGLELSDRPFLWVIRPDITNETNDSYPNGFHKRVANQGRMVGWAPQQKVLSHPSIACFVSHCGWNSTMEGVGNGVPFLCWPYFADQFLNESYICEVWEVGLKFDRNESGVITRDEIKKKVDQILGDRNFRARALELKEIAKKSVGEGGHSHKIFNNFIEWIKHS